jgi:hypothetical protein
MGLFVKMKVGVSMDLNAATALHKWLGDQISLLNSLPVKVPKQTIPTSEEIKKNQSATAPLAACAATCHTSLVGHSNTEPVSVAIRKEMILKANPVRRESSSILDRIDRISKNAELFDGEGAAPPAYVFAEAKRIVAETTARLNFMPDASISVFCDELNITWQNGDGIVRLACFPDRESVIQTGLVSAAGSYRSVSGGSIILAGKLKEMCGDTVVTEETISG